MSDRRPPKGLKDVVPPQSELMIRVEAPQKWGSGQGLCCGGIRSGVWEREREREREPLCLNPAGCLPGNVIHMWARVQLQEKEKILPAKKRLFLLFLLKFHAFWTLALVQQPTQKERYSVEKDKVRVERKLERIKTKAKGTENKIKIREPKEEWKRTHRKKA